MSEQPTYNPGDQVNGHVWTGTEWLPVAVPPTPKSPSPWRTVAAIGALICAAVAALMGVSWMSGFAELSDQENPFASILALLAMGAFAVAAAFGITGIVLLTKKS